jgi:phenylalanyl-tRNA synthetase beta chain
MKIPYRHFKKCINSNININQLSESFFQLGHEHEIYDDIFDFEITPNRGDCISLNGMLRDLNLFYDVSKDKCIYEKEIESFDFQFVNDAKDSCTSISFLKIDIDELPKKYLGSLEEYFLDLEVKKINFFTDISNFISYETGQPTHCYDSSKINGPLRLKFLK